MQNISDDIQMPYTVGVLFTNRNSMHSILYHLFLFQMEAKVLMVHLLRTFHVTLVQDYKLEMKQALSLSPKGGVPCTLVECA